jgi:hypothetical protein
MKPVNRMAIKYKKPKKYETGLCLNIWQAKVDIIIKNPDKADDLASKKNEFLYLHKMDWKRYVFLTEKEKYITIPKDSLNNYVVKVF